MSVHDVFPKLYIPSHKFIPVCLPLDSVAELACWLIWCALKDLLENPADILQDSGDKDSLLYSEFLMLYLAL
jgi:hypothetical protein